MRRYFLQHDPVACDKAILLYQKLGSIWKVAREIRYSAAAVNRLLTIRGVYKKHGKRPIGATYVKRGRIKVKTERGWQYRYRLEAAKIHGEDQIKGKDIHHKDSNSQNDEVSNLIPLTRSKHCGLHNSRRTNR